MTKYIIKNMGVKLFIPLIIALVVFPAAIIVGYFSLDDAETVKHFAVQFYQGFVPFLSIWWSIVYLSFKLETKGNEVFLLQKDKNNFKISFLFFIAFMLIILLVFTAFNFLLSGIIYEYLYILMLSFFFFSVAYTVSMILGKTFVALIFSVAACLISSIDEDKYSFLDFGDKTLSHTFSIGYPYVILGIVILVAGLLISKKRKTLV